MKEEIHKRLMSFCRTNASDIIIPNFFVNSWEADVLRLIKSGFWTEYEIKTSRSDFKADFKKSSNWYETKKHDLIRSGQRSNRFFFVVPAGLISVDECPSYAGLIYFQHGGLRIVKAAKLLHRNKFELDFHGLSQKLAFREQSWKDRYYRLRARSEQVVSMEREIEALKDLNKELHSQVQQYRWKERESLRK